MKILINGICIAFFITSCSSDDQQAMQNVNLVEKYIESVEQLDYETMASLLDENYLGLGPSYGDTITRDQAVENWKSNVQNFYEKIDYTRSRNAAIKITSGENQGDWVSNWAELFITYKDDRGTVGIWANSIYLIENDKIVKSYTFYNEADALRQLGYVFLHPNDL